jgi:hypothetical protein
MLFKFALEVGPIGDLQLAFIIPLLYDVITKLCIHKAKVVINHDIKIISSVGQGEAQHVEQERLSGLQLLII